MFRIGTSPKLPIPGSIDDAVVDEERDAVLQYVSGQGSVRNASAMLLTVGSLQIPLDTHWESAGDNSAPFVVDIDRFGDSTTVRLAMGLGRARFESVEQEQRLLMLAVEALLVFGLFFDGIPRADGEVVVNYLGKLWRLSDFGYATAGENTRA